jgi:hypothetical protein
MAARAMALQLPSAHVTDLRTIIDGEPTVTNGGIIIWATVELLYASETVDPDVTIVKLRRNARAPGLPRDPTVVVGAASPITTPRRGGREDERSTVACKPTGMSLPLRRRSIPVRALVLTTVKCLHWRCGHCKFECSALAAKSSISVLELYST